MTPRAAWLVAATLAALVAAVGAALGALDARLALWPFLHVSREEAWAHAALAVLLAAPAALARLAAAPRALRVVGGALVAVALVGALTPTLLGLAPRVGWRIEPGQSLAYAAGGIALLRAAR